MAFTIVMAWCASQLGPTTTSDPFLPPWHPIQRFLDVYDSDFGSSSDSDMKIVNVAFGLQPDNPMDRSEFGRFELEMGPLVDFETEDGSTCDFSTPELQQAVYDLCEDFQTLTVTGAGTDGEDTFLVRQASGLGEYEVNCWQIQFADWYQDNYNLPFPCQLDNCTDIIMEFQSTWTSLRSNEWYDDHIVYKDGTSHGHNHTHTNTNTNMHMHMHMHTHTLLLLLSLLWDTFFL